MYGELVKNIFKFNMNDILDELGITNNKLAVEAKVRPATIGDLCEGKTKRLELDTIEKILDVLNFKSSVVYNRQHYFSPAK
ncbi:helix-turn-helix domain-containing protein [Bacillus changyiensis]|uniref:helix-turn-helix domain-containing protein n=1 Tax=Bacillus changyiensis TaxID=3004103 RepID=UPI0022E753C0|nr:helix-turn-helix transcriptional regulator [Bacillus changyiensis]MDA1476283.1 helix-turn-helix transcriptional regulator [Bacillus changyiensis]